MGTVLAVISGKGGTGKTSLCAGIASCLAADSLRVLCIDADLGLRNLDISLGMSQEAVLPFTAVMRGEYELQQAAESAVIPNLYLLTAPVTELPEGIDPAQFGALLETAREQFDWVLIDAPAGVGAGFALATRFADEAVVVSNGDPASLRDAAHATDLLLQQRAIPTRLIVNRVSARMFGKMCATIDDVMDTVGLPLLGIVPEDASVTLAAAEGLPLVQYTGRGAARACLNIARRLCGKKMPLLHL